MSPIYELECLTCGSKQEALVKNKDELAEVACPTCGPGTMQAVFPTFSQYSIKGNNSASVTPKKYRGGK